VPAATDADAIVSAIMDRVDHRLDRHPLTAIGVDGRNGGPAGGKGPNVWLTDQLLSGTGRCRIET
jgi:hypothetical protein